MILPTVLALLAAFTFAANNATLRRGVVGGTLSQAMVVTLLLGAVLVWIVALAVGGAGQLREFPLRSTLFFCGAGLLHFGFGRYCNYRATQAMGTVLVGPVQQTSVLITLVLAILLLGERLTMLHIAGIALIMVAPMLAARAHTPSTFRWLKRTPGAEPAKPKPKPAANSFQPKLGEGYLFAVLSALAYGSSPILVREGMVEGSGMAGGLTGAAVAYSAATLAVIAIVICQGGLARSLTMSRPTLGWYSTAGVTAAASQVFVYMALSIAPASVVIPIQRTSLVMRVWFARLLNPEFESFDGPVLLATALSLVGAVALAADPAWFGMK
ncbi:EamA-like transporter family protein [Pigmentiphaga humi]|uniref:EamA-like transporter family protein n=1 Tax=Pigmentiphaga humi TaxID=2478468 RepID=A0A3P4B8X5_9BURK|nr:EamA family transporter [Pigmentiphaga humi]VCU72421.1 EamA-like transporter family protein [Pigmentiphaga humi]